MSAEEGKPKQPGNPAPTGPGRNCADWMGFTGGQTKPINPVALAQRKLEVIRLLVEGARVVEVAELVGVSMGTVYAYLRDPAVRAQIQQLNSQIMTQLDAEVVMKYRSKVEVIDEIANEALEAMREIIRDKSAHISVRAKMIDSALDRCPEVSRTKKLDVTNRSLSLTGEDLLHAAQAAAEMDEAAKRKVEEAVAAEQQNLVRD